MSKGVRFVLGTALMFVGGGTGALIAKSIGFNLLSSVIFEPRVPRTRRLPEQNVLLRSATEPQPVVYGTVKKSGVVAWMDTSGSNQQYLWFVVAIAGHEIDGYETVWINDTPIDVATEINGSGFVTKSDFVDSDGNNLVKISLYDGTQTTVDSDLNSTWGGYWSANHVGEGIAYAVVRLELDTSDGGNDPDNPEANVWSNGAPADIKFTIRGKKVYDPRLDSTNGGTGTHRYSDPSTWAYSVNPVLCIRDYLTDTRLGGAFAHTAIDDAVTITQANICDENVSVPDGSGGTQTQDRYTCNGYVSTADAPRNNLQYMLTSCMGTLVYTGGTFKIYAGAYPTPAHSIDETWLRGAVTVEAATSRTDLYNAVRGTYVSADEAYKEVEFEPRVSSAYEASDGRRRWDNMDLRFTKNEYEAQRLALIHLKKSRNQVVLSMQCNRKAVAVGLWETVTLTINDLGYNAKTFRVVGWRWNPDGGVDLTLREEESADWSYTAPDLDEVSFGTGVPNNLWRPPPVNDLDATGVSGGVRLDLSLPDMTGVKNVEIYAAATNSRPTSTTGRIGVTTSSYFVHALPDDTTRYYWALVRGLNNNASTWFPVSSTAGVSGTSLAAGAGDGDDGRSVAQLLVYRRSASAPPTPSGGSYDFGTQVLTVPSGWSENIPAGTDPVYMSRGVASVIGPTGTDTPFWATPALAFQDGSDGTDGADGDDGLSVANLSVFRRSATAPATPSGGSFNFGTQVLTPPTNWSLTIPTGTDPVYISNGIASVVGATGTDTPSWATPAKAYEDGVDGAPGSDGTDGSDGADGYSIVETYCYRRASAAPSTPTGGSYNFDTNTLTPPAGWSNSVPTGTDPCYVSVTTAAVQGGTGTDSSLTWTSPVIAFENGVDGADGADGDDGISVAIVKCYRRLSTTPSTPSGGSFNFGTLTLTPPSGWSTVPPSGSDTLWESQATASVTGASGIDSTLSWSTPAASTGLVETNSASGTSSSLTLNDHDCSGRPITVTVNGSLFGTTTTSSGATWALRLQRRIGSGSWTTIATWNGAETGIVSATGPFSWTRDTEFNPDQFSIISNTLGVVDNPGSGLIDYYLQFSLNPGGAASLTYSFSLSTREG